MRHWLLYSLSHITFICSQCTVNQYTHYHIILHIHNHNRIHIIISWAVEPSHTCVSLPIYTVAPTWTLQALTLCCVRLVEP